jgi:hypothetical protein
VWSRWHRLGRGRVCLNFRTMILRMSYHIVEVVVLPSISVVKWEVEMVHIQFYVLCKRVALAHCGYICFFFLFKSERSLRLNSPENEPRISKKTLSMTASPRALKVGPSHGQRTDTCERSNVGADEDGRKRRSSNIALYLFRVTPGFGLACDSLKACKALELGWMPCGIRTTSFTLKDVLTRRGLRVPQS